MTIAAGKPVVSGQRYTISDVAGHPPTGLRDFIGETAFTRGAGCPVLPVFGTGIEAAGVVRFHQKDLGQDGKDGAG